MKEEKNFMRVTGLMQIALLPNRAIFLPDLFTEIIKLENDLRELLDSGEYKKAIEKEKALRDKVLNLNDFEITIHF